MGPQCGNHRNRLRGNSSTHSSDGGEEVLLWLELWLKLLAVFVGVVVVMAVWVAGWAGGCPGEDTQKENLHPAQEQR